MSVPDDKQTSTPQDILKPPFDLALHLGLKPYAEFEKKMSSVIERITADERERFLRDIYRLAAKKVLMETARDDAENLARQLSEEAEKLQSASRHMEAAAQSLLKAASALPHEYQGRLESETIASQFHDIEQSMADKAQKLARYASVLRNLEGKDISVRGDTPSSLLYAFRLEKMDEVAPDLPSRERSLDGYIQHLAGPAATAPFGFHIPSGRKLTAIDHWLISAIAKYLPEAPAGKRLRFNRDEVICMTFEAALGDLMRTIAGIKSARRRKC
jgi:hypothetical protein